MGPLGEATVGELRASLRGELLTPGDPGYEGARAVWNGIVDRRPALIARCAGAADVLAAIGFARGEGLEVAVRSGGHHVAGHGTCDGGLVIDLGPMKGASVDSGKRLARAQGGLTWGELDRETQAFGLATTGGLVSTTGIAGLTLGGGIGWLARRHGLACDNLVSAEVATADGRLVTASEEENPELLWGLRGGGGNLGVATELTYRLHPLGPVIGGLLAWPLERAEDVLRVWRDWSAEAGDEVATVAALLHGKAASLIPDHGEGGSMLAIATCQTDTSPAGEEALSPLRGLDPHVDAIRPMSYVALQRILDAGAPRGARGHWRSAYLAELTDEAIEAVVACAEGIPAPLGQVHLHQLGGAVARVPDDATACGQRQSSFLLNLACTWPEPADTERSIAWVHETAEVIEPHATGRTYVNFLAEDGADRVRAAYEPRTYQRLRALKREHDPTNFFHLNHNIPPA